MVIFFRPFGLGVFDLGFLVCHFLKHRLTCTYTSLGAFPSEINKLKIFSNTQSIQLTQEKRNKNTTSASRYWCWIYIAHNDPPNVLQIKLFTSKLPQISHELIRKLSLAVYTDVKPQMKMFCKKTSYHIYHKQKHALGHRQQRSHQKPWSKKFFLLYFCFIAL